MARVFAIRVQGLIEAGIKSWYLLNVIVSRSELCKHRDKLITPTVRVSTSIFIFLVLYLILRMLVSRQLVLDGKPF